MRSQHKDYYIMFGLLRWFAGFTMIRFLILNSDLDDADTFLLSLSNIVIDIVTEVRYHLR